MNHLPEHLIYSLRNTQGFDEKSFIKIHDADKQITSVRLNQKKVTKEKIAQNDLKNTLSALPMDGKVPWSRNGYYLKERPLFYLDPLWHAGTYYVQEASSMCIEFVLTHLCDLSRPVRVLDLCAAPGGKSTAMAGLISAESILVSNEVIASRTHILEENIIKWGLPNVIVTQNDARDFGKLKEYFDIILVDAPCSGSGLFRKDPDSVREWSSEQVMLCSQRQKRILADIIPSLKKGGLLIYTTCSFSQEENEEMEDFLMQQFPLDNMAVPFKPEWNIVETYSHLLHVKGYRFYPYKLWGEGFFLSCFKKQNEGEGEESLTIKRQKKNSRLTEINDMQKSIWAPWIDEADNFIFFSLKDSIIAFPESSQLELITILSQLKVVYAGIKTGKMAGRDFIPHHALSMSINKNKNISSFDLNLPDAVRYLRKETLPMNEIPEGWLLAAYHGHGLGWMKGIRSRLNNYYPVNWRIRK
jgi:16S rRNA C967 or C1407 C5-methylase (RsmB/RsmF family)/NOL1/NOP2/fmu family ribosome biogenesis protein